MSIVSLLESRALTGLLVTLAAQSILISILGILILKWLARKPAPVRGLVCAGAMAALCLVFVVSIGFQRAGVAWYKSDLTDVWKTPLSDDKPMPEAQTTSTASPVMAPASTAPNPLENSHPMRMPVKANLLINAFGLIWVGGFVFLLLKLCYGLIFLQGFRFGLVQMMDRKFDSLVKNVAAGVFRKNRLPELYTSPKMESPITLGLLNPIVILPEKLQETLSENELKSILLHELAHIYHYDHVIGVIKRIVLAAHWWNPLAYRINAEHDLAREEVSDNYVLSELDPKEYSQCLAALAEKVSLISSFPAAAGMAGRRFNLVKRVENILSKKRSLAMRTSLNLKLMTFTVCAILTFFIAGLHGQVDTGTTSVVAIIPPSPQTSNNTIFLQMEGRKLTPEQAAELEKAVAQNPDDLKSQTLLLSYYFSKKYTNESQRDEAVFKKIEQTILWLIQNHPEVEVLGSPEGQIDIMQPNYAEGARLWKEQLLKRPNDLKILWNAGKYFMHGDLDLAINCYQKGKALDLENAAKWDRQLGQFYKFKMKKGPAGEAPALANEALSSLESAHAESNVMERNALLPDIAKAALAAGDTDKAVNYANQMLAASGEGWNKGNMIYYGNFVLGMVAVKNGDLESAEKYLLQAGDTPGSPQLNSFGPNMSLAKELLERGKRDTVLAFLKKCLKFWTISISPCSKWIQQIEEGQMPDFRMNLNY
jgi:beta-lactamase regulating signal transducer with metallopeptidase domain